MSMLIKSGNIVTSTSTYTADILVENGIITSIGSNLEKSLKNKPDEVINAKNRYILPGAIDPHTHLAMPFMGTYSQDDYETGSIAAACGGYTSIIDFVIQKKGESIKQAIDRKKGIADGKTALDYSLHPAITDMTPEIVDEIEYAIKDYGTPSIKLFMTYSFRVDDQVLLKVLNKTKQFGGLVQVHAENFHMIEYMNEIFAKEGKLAPIYHAKSRPNIAEQEAISRVIKFVELTNSRIYIVHLSSKEGLSEIISARDKNLEVYSETCLQYLLLNENCYNEKDWRGAKYVMSPPIRTKDSNTALWNGLKTGDIQTIGSDHCPFDFHGRKDMFGKDDYKKIPNGAPSIETSLILLHSEGVRKGKLTINELVKLTSTNVAKIFGMNQKGEIAIGKDADIVIFNPNQKFKIANDKLHMNVDYSPFEGMNITGMPEKVFSKGEKVSEWNDDRVKFVGKLGTGKFIKRKIIY